MAEPEHERNNAAYRRMKAAIDQTYPCGWYVAVFEDRIVGSAADFAELQRSLRANGLDSRRVLVVEAGVSYPEYVNIFGAHP